MEFCKILPKDGPYKALQFLYDSIGNDKIWKEKRVAYNEFVYQQRNYLFQEQKNIESKISRFDYLPKISIVMPVCNIRVSILEKALSSIKNQFYPHWELCIANGSSQPDIEILLDKFSSGDHRIKIKKLTSNIGVVRNSNEALTLATGEFIAFMDYDDELSPDAIYEVVSSLQDHPEADLLYTDEDKVTKNNFYFNPLKKPDWTPGLILSEHYISHLSVYRKTFLDKLGWLRTEYEGAQDYDLVLRATELTEKIVHIPKILYHWRAFRGSTALRGKEKPYVHISAQKAVKDALIRRGIKD